MTKTDAGDKASSKKKLNKKIKVAMIAPPWLAMPIKGYGGIELVVQGLIEELKQRDDIEVEVFANGHHKIDGVKTHSYYNKEIFDIIDIPYYDAPMQVLQTHLNFALKKIEEAGDFDIIHDHNPYIGPSFFSPVSRIKGLPPVLHTFHGPPFSSKETIAAGQYDNRPQLEFMNLGRIYMVCISEVMAKFAPKQIKPHLLPAVHNAIEYEKFPLVKNKKNYYITLARFTKDKNQALAAKYAAKYKKRLKMAGTVAGIGSVKKIMFEVSNPVSKLRKNEEYQYFKKRILPYVLKHTKITYEGNLSGEKKNRFLSEAKALLFPIDWEEPFGMAVIEALACGTPVVAMNRGAMPEIIQHGVNGFLADTEQDFFKYANQVDEIDPEKCRQSVIDHFSAKAMADEYIDRYKTIIKEAN